MPRLTAIALILTAVALQVLMFRSEPAAQNAAGDNKPGVNCERRFIDNGDGTITDTQRHLMWQKEDNGAPVTFEQARDYCRKLNLAGHSDWRLPNPDESEPQVAVQLMMPVHSRQAYAHFDLYWSSDPGVFIPFNYHPSHGVEIARAYPAFKGDCGYVRAVRPVEAGPGSR